MERLSGARWSGGLKKNPWANATFIFPSVSDVEKEFKRLSPEVANLIVKLHRLWLVAF